MVDNFIGLYLYVNTKQGTYYIFEKINFDYKKRQIKIKLVLFGKGVLMYGVVERTYYFLNHKPILLNERFVDPRPLTYDLWQTIDKLNNWVSKSV